MSNTLTVGRIEQLTHACPSEVPYLHRRQKNPAAELARVQAKIAHIHAIDDEERRRCFGVLEDGMQAVIRHLEAGNTAAALEAARTALSETDPITASAVCPAVPSAGEGEGGEGR